MKTATPQIGALRCTIIAEAGVNHNGSTELAHRLIDAAADAGADVVKFQTFRADRLASRRAHKAAYQERLTQQGESQLEMLKALELSEAAHRELLEHCSVRGVEFMSSPFDELSLEFLVALGVRRLKLGSGELTNAPLLLAAARTGLPLILSTGMSTLSEVEAALGVLAFGYDEPLATPSRNAFSEAWASYACRQRVAEQVLLLHCTTEYPAPRDQVNLRAMQTLGDAFGLACGYSDHTEGHAVSLAAVALGACVIEKHFTLSRTLPGPDHQASLEPATFKILVDGVREVEMALGDGRKVPMPVELPNMAVARKSLVAARPIAKGALIGPADLAIKRPGGGPSPFNYWSTLDQRAQRDFQPDDPLDFDAPGS
jgi:N-acetylneuraminate synthase